MASRLAPLCGLVLAGGASRRMGTDKGALRYHGPTQREVVAGLLSPWCERVYVSCRPDQAAGLEPGLEALIDPAPDLGPIAGVLAAFAARPDAAWIVVACDLPLLDAGAIADLVAHRSLDADAVAFTGDRGRPEPMAAVWEPALAPLVRAAVAAGRLSPREVLAAARCRLLPAPATALIDADTPLAGAAARQKLNLSAQEPI
ncbi:MAG: molybdenum cofactor guanylyltransferase [Candidatus Sericytochromatia bacterium]